MEEFDDLEARRERVGMLRSQGYTVKQIQTALGLTLGQARGDVRLFQPQPYDDDVRKLLTENLSYRAIGERLGISAAPVYQAVYRIKHPRPTIRVRTWKRIPNETRDAIRAFVKDNPNAKTRAIARRFGVGRTMVCIILKGRSTRYSRMRDAVRHFKRSPRSTVAQIAEIHGVSRCALSRRLRKLGIRRETMRLRILDAPPQWSKRQIARVLGCALSYVQNVLRGQKRPNDVPDYSAVSPDLLDHAYEIDAKEPPKEFERGIAPLRFPPIFMKQYVKVYYEARKIREEFTPEIRAICEQIKRGELEKEAHMREYRIGQSCGFFERSYNSFWDCVGK